MPSRKVFDDGADAAVTQLVVFGASGLTGLHVVRQALDTGLRVKAVTRSPAEYPLVSPLLTVVEADVLRRDAVDRAIAGGTTVISTFGVPYSLRDITVYSKGINNIARAMTRHGLSRLVCVSSTGASMREAPGETLFWRKIVFPFFQSVPGRTSYADMRRMEQTLRDSPLNWTVVRPAALFDTDLPTADYRVGPGRLPGRYTSRADLAQTLIREAVKPQYPGRIIEVTSQASLPSRAGFLASLLQSRR